MQSVGKGWQLRLAVLAIVAVAALVLAFVLPPYAQPQSYHAFADQRAWLGIPNYGNVMSNVLFLVAGIAGLQAMRTPALRALPSAPRHAYAVMFGGLVLTAFGSAYYHWAPSDARLLWDRLPIMLVCMPLLAATLVERLRWRSEWPLLGLTLLGLASVLVWHVSGNLMPYLLAQGGAIALLVLCIVLLPTPWTQRALLWPALACYALAFACERYDWPIYRLTYGMISGHTLKHGLAAASFLFILQMLRRQKLKTETTP